VRFDEDADRAWLMTYSEVSLEFVREEECDPVIRGSYPEDGLAGAGFVEIRLTRLLSGG
jgi:hypothetical protein